jgi:Kef-type K+ transport system membrane component KefB
MQEFLSFFIVIFAGVFFSEAFKRFHLPWVVTLILGGIIIGPHALGILHVNETIDFIGQIGLIFLMFMAGLETEFSSFKKFRKGIFGLSLLNSVIPFFVGIAIGIFFNYDLSTSILLGIVFVSSSIAIVVPSLKVNKMLDSKLGKSIVATTVMGDVASLILLSLFLQIVNPVSRIPLPLFYILLVFSLFAIRWLVPKIRFLFSLYLRDREDLFQEELRSILFILIGVVIIFEVLGLHPIVAGFFAGFVLSDSIKTKKMRKRLHILSYGLFIPTFFVIIGAKTNISVFSEAKGVLLFVLLIILGSTLSKFISGCLGGRLNGFSKKESLIIGVSTIPQLSTTLAVVFTANKLGLFDQKIMVAMITLSIVSTIISPILVKILSDQKEEIEEAINDQH